MPGLNDYIDAERSNRFKAAAMKKEWTERVAWCAAGKRASGPVHLTYRFYEPNKKRDKDNISGFAHKVIQDGLVSAGVIGNDGWAWVEGFEDFFDIDAKRPRVEVLVNDG